MEAQRSLPKESARIPAGLDDWRINRRVSLEDKALIERVQTGMGSRGLTPGPLGRSEVGLRSFARRMRELIPESRLERAPSAGWYARNGSTATHG